MFSAETGEVLGEYEGGRSSDALLAAVERRLLPAVQELSTTEEVDTFIKRYPSHALGFFEKDNEAAQKAFVLAAESAGKQAGGSRLVCGRIASLRVAQHVGIQYSPTLRVHRPALDKDGAERTGATELGVEPEEATIEFDFFSETGFTDERVELWLRAAAWPAVGAVSPSNFAEYQARNLPFAWVVLPGPARTPVNEDDEEAEEPTALPMTEAQKAANKATIDAVRGAALEQLGKVAFIHLDGTRFADHAETLGVDASRLPALAITNHTTREKWVFQPSASEFTAAAVQSWVAKWAAGGVKPYLRSQPAPEKPAPRGEVLELVGTTFTETVFGGKEDMFVMFYAPWCGHCKAAKPVWVELARKLADTTGIRIAQIDATANDVAGDVSGFPTFFFQPAGRKMRTVDSKYFYEGDRSMRGFMRYLRAKSSAKLPEDGPDMDFIRRMLSELPQLNVEIQRLVKENNALRRRLGDDVPASADVFADSSKDGAAAAAAAEEDGEADLEDEEDDEDDEEEDAVPAEEVDKTEWAEPTYEEEKAAAAAEQAAARDEL
jgi:protein disulfide isomerase